MTARPLCPLCGERIERLDRAAQATEVCDCCDQDLPGLVYWHRRCLAEATKTES